MHGIRTFNLSAFRPTSWNALRSGIEIMIHGIRTFDLSGFRPTSWNALRSDIEIMIHAFSERS
jgi:hypothetical protein